MRIHQFPAALQPIIQLGYLDREFEQAMNARLGFRGAAERRSTDEGPDAIVTGERATPNMRPEAYEVAISHYAATTDLNMVTARVGIASQFLQNAAINGDQAARSLNELARAALYGPLLKGQGTVIRPNNRDATAALAAVDTLTMGALLNAVAVLRGNAVPAVDGVYNCYLDPVSARQLFGDAEFRMLFTGATGAGQVFAKGMVNDFLGLRFIPSNEAYVDHHPSISGAVVRRPIVCGAGAVVEITSTADDALPDDTLVSRINGVCMVTHPPVDRLQQIIAQSWFWIGGYCAPWVAGDPERRIQRAVMIEHFG